MKLTQLKYFQTVCKYSSVTKAADELHLSQPSVSNGIRELEEEFGINLFHRMNRTLFLTKEGEFFLDRVNEILSKCDTLRQQMCDFGANKNHIKIGIPPMIGNFLFPSIFQRFKSIYPCIRMDLREQGSRGTVKLVMEDALDLALVITDDLNTPLLNIKPILTTQVSLAVNKQNPLAGEKKVTLDMLRDEPLLMFKEDYYLNRAILKRFHDLHIQPNIIVYTNQLDTMKSFIARNIASAFLFDEIIGEESGLVGIPLDEPLTVHIGLIWKKGIFPYSDVSKFIQFINDYPGRQ